jgi:membrane associated rhomboid family serine protease
MLFGLELGVGVMTAVAAAVVAAVVGALYIWTSRRRQFDRSESSEPKERGHSPI